MIKKKIIWLITVLMLFMQCAPAFAAKSGEKLDDDIELLICTDGKVGVYKKEAEVFSVPPYEIDGKVMIPVRWFFEKLGYTVSAEGERVKISGENELELSFNSNSANANGSAVNLSVPTGIKNNTLFAPEDVLSTLGIKYVKNSSGYLMITKSGHSDMSWESTLDKIEGIYVSPSGNDNMPGTAKEPVKTLEAAKKLAEKYIKSIGRDYTVRIFVKGGEYFVNKTVTFDDSAFSLDIYKGLSIEGYGDGETVFTGAVRLNQDDFVPVTDAKTLARLNKKGRGKIARMDLRKQGVGELTPKNNFFNYIYLNGIEQTNARWPNEGYALVGTVPDTNVFTFMESEPLKWTGEKEGYICGVFSNWGWEWHSAKIANVDAQKKQITLARIDADMKTTGGGSKYYATNILSELDSPGEWYVDYDEMALYYYPSYSLKYAKLEMTVFSDAIILLKDCKNITFKNLTFTKADRAIRTQSTSDGSVRNITVNGCRVSDMQGFAAIEFNNENSNAVYDIEITENDAYNLFGKFVQMKGGNWDGWKLGNCKINNNHVTRAAQYYCSGGMGSFWMGSCGMECNNNLVQDVPRGAAVGFEGKMNYNEIINTGKDMNDYGAIYVGRNGYKFGTEVAYNYIHDNADSNYCALYNDDAYCYADWHHNIVKDVRVTSIFAPGIEAKYRYNVQIGCKNPVQMSSRKGYGYVGQGEEIWNGLKKMADSYPIYLEREPQITKYLARDPFAVCWDSIVYGNIGVGQKTLSVYDWDELTEYGAKEMTENGKTVSIDGLNGSLEANPEVDYSDDLFVDAKNQNYNINPESELAEKFPGLLELDIEHSGISSKNPMLLEIPENGSRLRYPTNGQKNLNASAVTFSWDPVKGASFYRLTVATDPKMENVVFDETIRENGNVNTYTVEGLDNNTFYYWKVLSINVARQNGFSLESIGGPYLFKTAVRDTVDKENLKLALDSFEAFCRDDLSNTEYGYDEGYVKNAKDKLAEIKMKYKTVYSQSEIDALEEEIYTIVKKSPFYMKVHFENVDGIYDSGAKWEISADGRIDVSGGELTFSSGDGTRSDAKAKINNRNSILCFEVKLDNISEVASDYQGIDIKLSEAGSGYLIVFKKDIIEWQRINKTLTEIPNDFIEAGKWYKVEAGAVNTPNGVLQFLRIDGKMIYSELDQTSNQTRDEGYFRIRKNGKGSIHLRNMEQIPNDGIIIDDVIESFKKPVSAAHLETLFIGSADCLEMGNFKLFSLVDKKALGELVYPDVAEGKVNISRDEISEYRDFVKKMSVVAGYNTGLRDQLFKNNITFLYNDYIRTDLIDQNGVTIFGFYNKLNDKYKSIATELMMNSDCKNIDELRYHIAKTVFVTSINACRIGFAADATYISDVLTKENADYIGIDISDYLALSEVEKQAVNGIVGTEKGDCTDRTLDELTADIHDAVKRVTGSR